MIDFRKVSSAKVAPSSGVIFHANKPRKLFPKWPNRAARRPHVYNAKRRRDADRLRANRSGYAFISLLGLLFIGGGSALTWYGTQSEVKDLLLIGPGSVAIGLLCLAVGVAFVARLAYYRWYAGRESVEFGRATTPEETAPPPPGAALYGEQEPTGIQPVLTPPICCRIPATAASNAECRPPNDGQVEPSFQVTNDARFVVTTTAQTRLTQCPEGNVSNSADRDCPRNGGVTHNDNSLNNKQRSRPDSGYDGV